MRGKREREVIPFCFLCVSRYRTTKDITLPFRVIPLVRLSAQNHMEIKVRGHVCITESPSHHFILSLFPPSPCLR